MELTMSEREIGRLRVLEQVSAGKLSQTQAAAILELSTRQVRRLERRYTSAGAAGLVHMLRGRASNRALAAAQAQAIQALLARHYADFGPTLACEKLAERHGVMISVETVRRLMSEAGLWHPKRARRKAVHALRERRARRGELIQIDGSLHRWFEQRAPGCTLLVFIDDATSELMALRFVRAESTLAYMDVLREYILAHGLPVALYSDRHGVFRVNNGSGEPRLTQFSRALAELGIEGIHASTPQAKGRVERANQTLQDRLVKELRLAGISDMKQANAWLPSFVQAYNRRFAVEPRVALDAHVRYCGKRAALAHILAVHETRRLSASLSCQFHNHLVQVHAPGGERRLSGSQVTLVTHPNGRLEMYCGPQSLSFEMRARKPGQAPCADSKTVDARVQQAIMRRSASPAPAPNHPWRRWLGAAPNPRELHAR
jgi:transposase